MRTTTLASFLLSVCVAGCLTAAANADEREVEEVRKQAAALLREAKDHVFGGNAERASDLANRAYALQAEANKMEHRRRQEHHERLLGEKHKRQEEHEHPRHGHEHINHLRQAAEHLHAAGMHEQAEDLMREAERREQELQREHPSHGDDDLRGYLEKLTAQVRELSARIERLERFIHEIAKRHDG